MKEYLNILGHQVRDRVTGFTGIATTVAFDLYGCVQVIVSQPGVNDKGETKPGAWFDFKRLVVDSLIPVMDQPVFQQIGSEEGGYEKPLR